MTADTSLTVATLLRVVDNQNRPNQNGGHHSHLPIEYWGKPRNVKPAPRLNVSFIRTVLGDERFSLPKIGNKLPERQSGSQNKIEFSSQNREDTGLSLPEIKRNSRLSRRNIPSSRSLPVPQSDRRYSPGRTVVNQTERLPQISEAQSEINSPDSKPAWGKDDNVKNSQLNKKFSERLTVHVPGQDGSRGHSIVQKLSSSGDVRPPLVSIHSSVSTINHRLPDNRHLITDNTHFSYHHTKANERPNLPHSDSNGDGVPRDMLQSPLYHIRSVGNRIQNRNPDSPLNSFGSESAQSSQIHRLFQSQPSSIASRRSSKLIGYKMRMTGTDNDISNGVDIDVTRDDIAGYPLYSDIGSSVGSILGFNVSSNPSESFDGSLGQVDTLVQDSPTSAPMVVDENPILANQTYVMGQKPQKRKRIKVLDKGVNIHRRAYLAALSVARSQQLPNDFRQLGKRVSRPFQFSYFQHIPHQRPCRCAECRERMVNNAIVPKKNKQKKLSPIKSIFGSVKVEDYYFRSSLVSD